MNRNTRTTRTTTEGAVGRRTRATAGTGGRQMNAPGGPAAGGLNTRTTAASRAKGGVSANMATGSGKEQRRPNESSVTASAKPAKRTGPKGSTWEQKYNALQEEMVTMQEKLAESEAMCAKYRKALEDNGVDAVTFKKFQVLETTGEVVSSEEQEQYEKEIQQLREQILKRRTEQLPSKIDEIAQITEQMKML